MWLWLLAMLGLAAHGADLDSYGGWKQVSSRATGFFRVEQSGGRWWFITPEGHAFLSAGVNHVDYKGDYSPAFARFVSRNLHDWGFNTIGWTQESMNSTFAKGQVVHSKGWGPEQYRAARMPYLHMIPFAQLAWYENEEFPDVFSDAFAQKCDRLAREVCPQLRDDPYLIGYFYVDTPNWPLWAEKVGHGKIGAVARRYYQVIHDAIRRYDPNHLLLGDRYKGDASIPIGAGKRNGLLPEVLDAMRGAVDVLSVEYYAPREGFARDLERWHERTGKPILLADSAFLAPTDVLKVDEKWSAYRPGQAERGRAYQEFAEKVYQWPFVVGWHWCAFGRSKGRRSGLLDGQDQPYSEATTRMAQFNRQRLYQTALSPSPDQRRDPYGGTVAVTSKATGYFRSEKINGRWWLITPGGNGYISMGMNHLDLAALKYPDNIHIFRERYGGSTDRYIREGIAEPLRAWGFNSIGWSREVVGGIWMDPKALLRHSPEWSQREFQVAGLPYLYNLEFAEFETFNMQPYYPDVFSKDFEEWADYRARSSAIELANDPLLLGYADLPVPNFTLNRPGAWAHGLNLDDAADRAKLERIIRRYFEVTTAAIRRYDRNHMIYGPRFDRPPNTPDWIVKIAGEYFDGILCNLFVTPEQVATSVKRWHELTGKPIIISDMLYLAPTKILEVSKTSNSYVPDQAARGEAYRKFAAEVLKQPFIVGIHWCAFLENRARKSGIKTYLDEPYHECVRRMEDFNRNHVYGTALSGSR